MVGRNDYLSLGRRNCRMH